MSEQAAPETLAELLAHFDFLQIVDKYKNGIDSLLGKDFGEAVELSGGEWQKIAIIRALVWPKGAYIFDEPTAALDPIKEVETFTKIRERTSDRLSIFITHRLGFTSKVDKILMIKDNTVIEQGTFPELMAHQGAFYHLYSAQKSLYVQ